MCGSRTRCLIDNGSDLYLGGISLEFRRDINSFEVHFVICISLQANAAVRLSEEKTTSFHIFVSLFASRTKHPKLYHLRYCLVS